MQALNFVQCVLCILLKEMNDFWKCVTEKEAFPYWGWTWVKLLASVFTCILVTVCFVQE